jgi:hypothetical protein
MNADIELAPDQWEALKALRVPASQERAQNRFALEKLVALQLAEMIGDNLVLTSKGRSVLLRGSPQLWDVAA